MTAAAKMKVDGCRSTEPRRGITRAYPIKFSFKALAITVGYHERMGLGVACWRHPQKAAALRSHQPFMAIANVPIGIDRGYVERQHPRSVCAINQNPCAGFVRQRGEFANRENDSAWRADVVENGQPRAWAESVGNCAEDLNRVANWKRHLGLYYASTCARRVIFEGFSDRRIAVVCYQNFVTLRQSDRSQYRAAASG